MTDNKLSILSSNFARLADGIDGKLNETITAMLEKQTNAATVGVKISIELRERVTLRDGKEESYTIPIISWKITGAMKLESKEEDSLMGENMLEYDSAYGCWRLAEVPEQQVRLFEES